MTGDTSFACGDDDVDEAEEFPDEEPRSDPDDDEPDPGDARPVVWYCPECGARVSDEDRVICEECRPTARKEKPMLQQIQEQHKTDGEGRPAGGTTKGMGIAITWQDGPLGRGADRKEPNGAFVEGVLQAALGRLRFYQTTEFRCADNACAIASIENALHHLQARTRNREARGVEGTHEK